jgi:hypothetical protein
MPFCFKVPKNANVVFPTLNVIKLQQLAEALKVSTSDFFEDKDVRGLPLDVREGELLHLGKLRTPN